MARRSRPDVGTSGRVRSRLGRAKSRSPVGICDSDTSIPCSGAARVRESLRVSKKSGGGPAGRRWDGAVGDRLDDRAGGDDLAILARSGLMGSVARHGVPFALANQTLTAKGGPRRPGAGRRDPLRQEGRPGERAGSLASEYRIQGYSSRLAMPGQRYTCRRQWITDPGRT